MSNEQNYTVILSAIIAEMRLTKEININLRKKLSECQSKPLALNSAAVPKCELGYDHKETPCLEGQKEDPNWQGSPEKGYCCDDPCPVGEVHFRSKDEIPADFDFNSQCEVEVSVGGFCCDLG